jgi:ribosomal protein S27AE
MRPFNNGKPFHGSEAVQAGSLTGATDTDYFYFFCPRCGPTHILQLLDFGTVIDRPAERYPEIRPGAKRDFTLAFQVRCDRCGLTDFFKISNWRWQGGELKDVPWSSSELVNQTQKSDP